MTRILVDFFYAHPVGHAIEALHHCLALHEADPTAEIGVVLSARTPAELASCCPFVTHAYAVDAPFLEPAPDALASIAHIPREWDWVVSDARRVQDVQLTMFPGMRDHYEASDSWFVTDVGRSLTGAPRPPRKAHTRLRLELPEHARAAAGFAGETIALTPAGSSDASTYPSASSWLAILDAVAEARPGLGVVLVGRRPHPDGRTATSFPEVGLERVLAHPAVVGEVFDRPLLEQLAVVERCRAFLSPHTGFGMAALAVGTPWLAVSGGRWYEWYLDHVPFRSIVPDTTRYPAFSQLEAHSTVIDGDEGERIPSMTRERILEDLPRIVAGLEDLLEQRVSYEQCLADYGRDLLRAHGGDRTGVWSWDDVLSEHLR